MCSSSSDPILLLLRVVSPILLRLLLEELNTPQGRQDFIDILVQLGILSPREAREYMARTKLNVDQVVYELNRLLK